MPLSTLDPKPALVVIDLQQAVLGVPADPPVTDALPRAASLTVSLAPQQRRSA